jgi:uncharacterized protein YcnI
VKKTFLIAAALLASSAQAHITLEQDSARAGSYQKLTFRVGHGCDGSPKAPAPVLNVLPAEGAVHQH